MDDVDRDDMIVEQRIAGESARALAKQYGCSSSEVEAAVDRRLDYEINNDMRLRAIKLDVARLDALTAPFFERAIKDRDVAAGTLCVKILERRALLLGLDSPTRVDVVQLQAQQQPSSYEKIKVAIMALKSANGQQPNDGDDSPPVGS